jgi:hypothetical protein
MRRSDVKCGLWIKRQDGRHPGSIPGSSNEFFHNVQAEKYSGECSSEVDCASVLLKYIVRVFY